MLNNKFFKVVLLTAMFSAVLSQAGTIKTWVSGDTLTVSDLNSNFQHIHNAMVGGHGARLVNADVSATASIGYTKIQNGLGIARAMGSVASCTADGGCTIHESLNVTSVTRNGTGHYDVLLNYTATDNKFVTVASAGAAAGTVANVDLCQAVATGTTTLSVICWSLAAAPAVVADSPFTFVVFDAN